MHTTIRAIALLLFLSLISSATVGQEAPTATGLSDAHITLIDRLYTVSDFQLRFTKAMENNATFAEHAADKVFVKGVTDAAIESAFNTYGSSIKEAVLTLSDQQADSLNVLLDSPAGPLLLNMFALDNAYVETQLQAHVNTLTERGLAASVAFDSILYNRQFSHDLREVMDGTYLDSLSFGQPVTVVRTGDQQLEVFGSDTIELAVRWLSNNRYALDPPQENPFGTSEEVVVNIYEIEGDEFRYIWRNPDGTYTKHALIKSNYASYAQEITTFQWALTEQYLHFDSSPLPEAEIPAFATAGGHQFFPTDEAYRITARLLRDTSGREWTMPTSDGGEKTFDVYGTATFTLLGAERQLTLYQSRAPGAEERPLLFLPFRDATSGSLTYGGGRYLDLPVPVGEELIIDFNKAYHPYCAYAEGYACPVPPEGNTLGVGVEAGIRLRP